MSECGNAVPADWNETKDYLTRIVSHSEPEQAFYGRQSFALFLEHGFTHESPGKLTEAERSKFATAIASSEAGHTITMSDLPEVRDLKAQRRLGNWVFNIIRHDVPVRPEKIRDMDVTGVTYSSSTVFRDLSTIYNFHIPGSESSKLHDLTAIARSTSRPLGQLGPFVPGLAVLITDGPIAFEDLFLIPSLATNFSFDPSLYVLLVKNRSFAFLSKRWWSSASPTSLSYSNPGQPFSAFPEALAEVAARAKSEGRRIEILYQP